MRLLTALLVALCLTVSGGAVALTGGAPGTPVLSSGKHTLGDVALVKPSLLKLQAGLSPDTPADRSRDALHLAPATPITSVPRDSAGAPLGSVLPAALLCFPSHPTRAGPCPRG